MISAAEMSVQCRCFNLQRAARKVARHYDAALKPLKLTSGQVTILAALNRPEPVVLGALATQLGIERTTLTRNLALLERRGLIVVRGDAKDQRARAIALAPPGRDLLAAAMPCWRAAQAASLAAIEGLDWSDVRLALTLLAAI